MPRYYSDRHFSDPSTAELKMKSVFVGFLLTLLIGDIVGPGTVSYYDVLAKMVSLLFLFYEYIFNANFSAPIVFLATL